MSDRISVLVIVALCLAVIPLRAQSVVPRPLGQGLPVYRPPMPDLETYVEVQNPTGPVALRDVLALALMRSPDLAAFAWEVRALEARVLQAGRPPNPVLSSLLEDLGGTGGLTGADSLIQPQLTIQLGQLVEVGGKRAARQELAASTRHLAEWDYESARIDVLTRVTKAFVAVVASQQRLALSEEAVRLSAQMSQTVAARVDAGVVSPIEQTRADVALASARIEAERAKRTLEADRGRLAALWGAPDARFASASGELTPPQPLTPLPVLTERLALNPDLARWATEITQRQAAVSLEQAKRVPDLTFTGGYRRFTRIDANALVVGASISLPIFDRNTGGIREASGRLNKAHEERRAAEARVAALLAESYQALATAHGEVEALSAHVLPGAKATLDAVSEGYRLGRFGYLDVLDAQRTLALANGQHLRALADYHQAAADVERLIGAPLSTLPSTPAAGIK